MSSLLLCHPESYINIGTAVEWRTVLKNHSTGMWIKTTVQHTMCLLSLSNENHEVFTINMNVEKAHCPSEASGGLEVRLEDVDGNVTDAMSPVPPLADDQWHLIEVGITEVPRGDEDPSGVSNVNLSTVNVVFRVDGCVLSTIYRRRDRLGCFKSEKLLERPVYPAYDLLCARNRGKHIQDHFRGYISDVFVCRGVPFDGPKLHWWIVEMRSGRTVWDRGDHSSPVMHLHCCDCEWEPNDHPSLALFVNGSEGFFCKSRTLNRQFFAQLSASNAVLPTDFELDKNDVPLSIPFAFLSASQSGTPMHRPNAVSPKSPGVTSGGSGGSINDFALTPKARSPKSGIPPTPKLKTPATPSLNYTGLEKTISTFRQRVGLSLWLRSTTADPSVVIYVPLSERDVSLVLNHDNRKNVALVVGTTAYVANVDVCDGLWRHINWSVDPITGISCYLNGQLSTWESTTINLDTDTSSTADDHSSASPSQRTSQVFETPDIASLNPETGAPIKRFSKSIEDAAAIWQADSPENVFGIDMEKERRRSSRTAFINALKPIRSRRPTNTTQRSSITEDLEHQEGLSEGTLTIGHFYTGFLRDLRIYVGDHSIYWSFTQGTGSSVPGVPSFPAPATEQLDLEICGRHPIWPKCQVPKCSIPFSPTAAIALQFLWAGLHGRWTASVWYLSHSSRSANCGVRSGEVANYHSTSPRRRRFDFEATGHFQENAPRSDCAKRRRTKSGG